MNNLKKRYEKACNDYVNRFCEKQDMTFEGWIGDEIGGVAECSDFYFNLRDIIWDINSEQKEGVIIDWYYAVLSNEDRKPMPLPSINYYSWTKGLTYDYLEEMERDEDKIPPAPLSEGGIIQTPPLSPSQGGINAESPNDEDGINEEGFNSPLLRGIKGDDDIIGTNPVMESLKKTFMNAFDDYNSKQVTE